MPIDRLLTIDSFAFVGLPAVLTAIAMSASTVIAHAQDANYDEDKVPAYELPDPLLMADGERVTTAEQWNEVQRPHLLDLMAKEMFGVSPAAPGSVAFEVIAANSDALGGKATQTQITVYFSGDRDGPQMDLLIYAPKDIEGGAPAFLTLNFYGNHTISDDPSIKLNPRWMRNNNDKGVVDNQATEASRGTNATRWPVEKIIDRGYALVTIYYGDIDPDFDDGFANGVHPLFYDQGQTRPREDQWGSIAAWAWGLSRAMDCLEALDIVDAKRVAVMGHSRLGKTALWAGATDSRFAITISNNSGCGGAALSRRSYGETVQRINRSFPHWFCARFKQYDANENSIPFDQHTLISLIAPRPVYVASAEEDRWADPRGEFLSARFADPVYRLLGTDGIATTDMPDVNEPLMSTIGYHIRTGRHDVTDFDWNCYLDFADKHMPPATGDGN